MNVIGLDTGFFVQLLDGRAPSQEVLTSIRTDGVHAVASCVSYYELLKIGLRGRIQLDVVEAFVDRMRIACEIIWLSEAHSSLVDEAARLSHGTGLAMADAIILASTLHAKADVLYTTDSDFTDPCTSK